MDVFYEPALDDILLPFIEDRIEDFFNEEVFEDYVSASIGGYELSDLSDEYLEIINSAMERWNHEMVKLFSTFSSNIKKSF